MGVQDRGIPTLFVVPFINLLLGILLFISLLYGRRELTALAILVLAMSGGTKLWSRLSLKGLSCRLTIDKLRLFPDEKLTLNVAAENRKILPVWLHLKVPVGGGLHRLTGEEVLIREGGLLWYQKSDFRWELKAPARGVYSLGPLHLFAGDLFDFFSRGRRESRIHEVIVYPRLVSLRKMPFPRHDFFGRPGVKSPVLDPVYILGTRDYQSGQSAKYIHWKASARHDRIQEKVFEPSMQEKVLILIDVERFAGRGARRSFERTLEAAASLAARLDKGGHAVGLATNGVLKGGNRPFVPVARHDRQLPAILEILARLEMEPRMPLAEMLHGMELTWGLSCLLFAYEPDAAAFATERYLKDRHTPVVYVMSRFSSAEKDSMNMGGDMYSIDDICIPPAEGR